MSYQFTWADNDLEKLLRGEPTESRAFKMELNVAIDTPDRYWLLAALSETWGESNAEDATSVRVFTGVSLTPDMSLGLEGQYNFDVRQGRLQEVVAGEKYYLRLHWELYF